MHRLPLALAACLAILAGCAAESPAIVGKSPHYRARNDKLGINLDLQGHNALQSTFVFDA